MSTRVIGFRRKSRIAALQTLYEIDLSDHNPDEILTRLVQDKDLPEETATFAQELVNGTLNNKHAIDEIIKKYASTFPIEQIAPIDKNVLRLAIFEILFDNKVPVKAAINEAIELAKSFGSNTSAKFINGVLGSIVTEHEQPETQ